MPSTHADARPPRTPADASVAQRRQRRGREGDGVPSRERAASGVPGVPSAAACAGARPAGVTAVRMRRTRWLGHAPRITLPLSQPLRPLPHPLPQTAARRVTAATTDARPLSPTAAWRLVHRGARAASGRVTRALTCCCCTVDAFCDAAAWATRVPPPPRLLSGANKHSAKSGASAAPPRSRVAVPAAAAPLRPGRAMLARYARSRCPPLPSAALPPPFRAVELLQNTASVFVGDQRKRICRLDWTPKAQEECVRRSSFCTLTPMTRSSSPRACGRARLAEGLGERGC
eukprot:118837-Chlamydomonas_euryale.AAC.6